MHLELKFVPKVGAILTKSTVVVVDTYENGW